MEKSSFAALVAVTAHQALALVAALDSSSTLHHRLAMLADPTAPHAAALTLSLATVVSPSLTLLIIILARAAIEAV